MARRSELSQAAATLGRRGGSVTSERKTASSRANGQRGGRPISNLENTYHRDGSVTYWSTYTLTWTRQHAATIPNRELAAMSSAEREAIAHHAAWHPLPEE